MTEHSRTLLEVNDLKMHFPIRRGVLKRTVGYVRAVDGISFAVRRGETLGLVGESGCGKTTAGRCIVRAYQPTSGEVLYHADSAGGAPVDFAQLSHHDLRSFRHEIQMIFQDPYSSLNPRMTVLDIVSEPLVIREGKTPTKFKEEVAGLLRKVGLRPEHMNRYPNAFSGGQRQRIGIARALALHPQLVICDEPVSALDVSVQAQILNLLQSLRAQLGLTYLFISHDLSVVRHLSNRVVVMYVGKIVEVASTEALFTDVQHPYTSALLASAPTPDPRAKRNSKPLAGEVADPANPPRGCYFHPRCPFAQERCKVEPPPLREVKPDHWASCHFSEKLALQH